MKDNQFANKVALVTGALTGIGAAIVRALTEDGAIVNASHYRRDEKAEAGLLEHASNTAGSVFFHCLDVCEEADWKQAMDAIYSDHRRLDILVNNAGRPAPQDIETVTLTEWRQTMAVNLDGAFLGTRFGIAAIKRHGDGGSIINVGSVMGLMADANQIAYSTSKAGLRMLTRAAALHCAAADYGIRVNSVCPGFTHTPMLERFLAAHGDMQEGLQAVADRSPIKRLATPDEIAQAVIYLCSQEAAFATGIDLLLDGGLSIQTA